MTTSFNLNQIFVTSQRFYGRFIEGVIFIGWKWTESPSLPYRGWSFSWRRLILSCYQDIGRHVHRLLYLSYSYITYFFFVGVIWETIISKIWMHLFKIYFNLSVWFDLNYPARHSFLFPHFPWQFSCKKYQKLTRFIKFMTIYHSNSILYAYYNWQSPLLLLKRQTTWVTSLFSSPTNRLDQAP